MDTTKPRTCYEGTDRGLVEQAFDRLLEWEQNRIPDEERQWRLTPKQYYELLKDLPVATVEKPPYGSMRLFAYPVILLRPDGSTRDGSR